MLIVSRKVLTRLQFHVRNRVVWVVWLAALDGINLAANNNTVITNTGTHNGAILSMIVHNLCLSALNFIASAVLPLFGQSSERLEFVACVKQSEPALR